MKCIGVSRNGTLSADIVVASLVDLSGDAFEKLIAGSSA
jgi:hypothetical protein